MNIQKRRLNFFVFYLFVLCYSLNQLQLPVFAHAGEENRSATVAEQCAIDGSDPICEKIEANPHLGDDLVDMTAEEEAALIERAEREKIGQNPDQNGRNVLGSEHLIGRWEGPYNWPVIGVFASLLPNGKVLAFDSVGDNPTESYTNQTFTRATIWDPTNNTHTSVNANTGYNLFCSGFATLPDGRLFVAGGNKNTALDGINKTHIFNYLTNSWSLEGTMRYERWYPAVTPLNNGEMLITGGGPAISEVRQTNATLRVLSNASQSLWANRDYPWLQVAPNGKVAYLGPNKQLGYLTADGNGSWQSTISRDALYRNYGSYAMYDVGKVLVAGGDYSTNSAVVVNLNNSSVANTSNMAYRRRQHNLTVLADGTVLATGGLSSSAGLVDSANAVYVPELWNPATGQWTQMAGMARARMYHSTALLLPDGRILSAGGGICGDCQTYGYIQKNAEIYSPPYLYKKDGSGQLATRPIIDNAPATLGYNRPFTLLTAQASTITKISLIRIGSVTHSGNMEQRYLPLSFTVGNRSLNVTSPANSSVAPPGYYMIFLIDNQGVPSVSKIVQLRELPDNQLPVAQLTATPTSGMAPLAVAFDGSTSYDLDGAIVTYQWEFGDGTTATGATASHSYQAGNYTVRLTVTSSDGGTATTTQNIVVNSNAPLLTMGVSLQPSRSTIPPSGGYVDYGVVVQNTSSADSWQYPIQTVKYSDNLAGELAPNPFSYETNCFWWLPTLWPSQSWPCSYNILITATTNRTVTVNAIAANGAITLQQAGSATVNVAEGSGVATATWWRNNPDQIASLIRPIDTNNDGTADLTGVLIGDWNLNGRCDIYEIWWTKKCVVLTAAQIQTVFNTPINGDERLTLFQSLLATWLNIASGNDYLCATMDTPVNLALIWLYDYAPQGNPLDGGTAVATNSQIWNDFSWDHYWMASYNENGGTNCAIDRDTGRRTTVARSADAEFDFFAPPPFVATVDPVLVAGYNAVLANNPSLRDETLGLYRETIGLVMRDGIVSADYLTRLHTTFDRILPVSKLSIAYKLKLLWVDLNVDQYEGQSARQAWSKLGVKDSAETSMTPRIFLPLILR